MGRITNDRNLHVLNKIKFDSALLPRFSYLDKPYLTVNTIYKQSFNPFKMTIEQNIETQTKSIKPNGIKTFIPKAENCEQLFGMCNSFLIS